MNEMNEINGMSYLYYALIGYLGGSVLFGYWIPKKLKGIDVREESEDGNPGAANAFTQAGIFCGILVLCCDLLKGAIPVFLASRHLDPSYILFSLVLVAPVLGHMFPVFHFFKNGGKGIAVTFGVFLGLFPNLEPAVILAFWFLFFSLVIILRPHSVRTAAAYLLWFITVLFFLKSRVLLFSVGVISALVVTKHCREIREESEPTEVRFAFRKKGR